MEIDIYTPCKDGYEIKHRFGSWRTAYLRYAERFDTVTYLGRHLETDEVFVLLKGSAVLLSGKNAELTPMELGNIYNVRKGVWHNIKVSKDALVLVVENADTCKENSEYIPIDTAHSFTDDIFQ